MAILVELAILVIAIVIAMLIWKVAQSWIRVSDAKAKELEAKAKAQLKVIEGSKKDKKEEK